MTSPQPSYRLVRPAAPSGPLVAEVVLDDEQRRVVDHPGGPLLVLAGPGTGKTTTLVEAIARRIEAGAPPDSVLALTFSRKAAEQLRDRVTARVGRTTGAALGSTFHSFAYGLIRAYAPAELYVEPLRLLSAPEQDVVLRELLTDDADPVTWPESLGAALGTRGFAREVHAVLSRAREKGLDGEALTRLGEEHDLPEFVAAGRFLELYLTNLDHQGLTDYSDLIRRATIEAEAHRDELRARFQHVFVDEYQDTDPGQVALLRTLAGDGRDLVAVGDPHQSIYAFRGAEVRGILEFPTEFPRADGAPADVVALRTTRRFGSRLLLASQRVARRLALPGTIDPAAREAFHRPQAAPGPHGDGLVVVRTFDTERAEAEHLADLLRRAHLEDGVPWHEMAVLVRSGRVSIPPLRRALGAAGVPVEVASDEVPLVRDPAVLPLLDAVRAALELDNDDLDDPRYVDATRAAALLTGPLGGLDAGDVRLLARRLRTRERALATAEDRSPQPSRELVRRAVVERAFLDDPSLDDPSLDDPSLDDPSLDDAIDAGVPTRWSSSEQSERSVETTPLARARALHRLLTSSADELTSGGSAEQVLWRMWTSTDWPERLRRGVDQGGATARRAHRDLDAICALFDVAARVGEQRNRLGVREFVDGLVAQEIPADTLAERGVRGSAVRLLTAHRAKGLEWRLVVVAHVQHEGWPDLRRRTTLLRADRIGSDAEIVPPVSARQLLLEERRLFYVACTRARERLVVTAVASPDDDGEQPSRFLDELGVPVGAITGRPARPLSMAGLVSELRRTVADPTTTQPLRGAAARRLARLAGETRGTRPLVPQADPSSWWGTRAASRSVEPVRDPDRPVPVSATVLEAMSVCPTQWFLQREAGGVGASHQSANIGQIVHALADRVAHGELPAELDVLMGHVEEVWGRLSFRTPWSKAREGERVRSALERFLTWHAANARTVLDTESRFQAEVELDDGERVVLMGAADRLELAADGSVVVVDLKTSKYAPSGPAVQRHVQLGVYQYAVEAGAVDALLPEGHPGARSGGAELVQLGLPGDSPDATVQRQDQQGDDGPERRALRAQIDRAAAYLRAETFPAVAGPHCRDCSFVPLCPVKSAGAVTSR